MSLTEPIILNSLLCDYNYIAILNYCFRFQLARINISLQVAKFELQLAFWTQLDPFLAPRVLASAHAWIIYSKFVWFNLISSAS